MDSLDQLVHALRCLPGVGPKSAQRMVYHLLQFQRNKGLHLSDCLKNAMQRVVHCTQCNNFTELDLCSLCTDTSRDAKTLCIVENPCDVTAIEQSLAFKGRYFVLMGKISPLDGLSAEDIGLPRLKELVSTKGINEIILALGSSVESQITAHFISELLQDAHVTISQLAHGIPSGGELEFLDSLTIGNALRNRFALHD